MPAGQGKQLELFDFEAKVPAPQSEQAEAPSFEYEPGRQSVQAAAATPLHEPAWHFVQTRMLLPSEKVPAGQLKHPPVLPTVEVVPARHFVGEDCPSAET